MASLDDHGRWVWVGPSLKEAFSPFVVDRYSPNSADRDEHIVFLNIHIYTRIIDEYCDLYLAGHISVNTTTIAA